MVVEVLLAAMVLGATGWLVAAVSLDGTVRLRLPGVRLPRPRLPHRLRFPSRGAAAGRGPHPPPTPAPAALPRRRASRWSLGAPTTLAEDLSRGARARRGGRVGPGARRGRPHWRDRGELQRRVGAALRLLLLVTVLGVALGAVLATVILTTVGRSPALAP